MKYNEILNEKLLPSEFKWGFELECFYVGTEMDVGWNPAQQTIEDDKIFRRHLANLFKPYFPNYGISLYDIKHDGSVKSKNKEDVGFEFVSPVMQFTPDNIKSVKSLLENLPELDLKTNETCGFHIHFSFPKISDTDAAWLICKLAQDTDMQKRIKFFEDINFFNSDYASVNFLSSLENLIDRKIWNQLKLVIGNSKYRLMRVHPQGTLEWRGPRNFLNTGKTDLIKKFLLLVYGFVKWMSDSLSSNDLNGLSRKDFNEMFEGVDLFSARPKANIDPRFSSHQDLKILDDIFKRAPWLNKAKFRDTELVINKDTEAVSMVGGTWISGDWQNGIMSDVEFLSGTFVAGHYYGGVWHTGTFSGTFTHGTWVDGTFVNGIFSRNSKWQNGIFLSGEFLNSQWKNGVWKNGVFKGSEWYDGVFENGIFDTSSWSGGTWKKGNWKNSTNLVDLTQSHPKQKN